MTRFILLVVFSLTFLCGCNTSLNYAERMAPGMPPLWQEAYSAGCDSGYSAAGNPYYKFRKDYPLYKNGEEYKDGWDAGYDACKTQYSNLGRDF